MNNSSLTTQGGNAATTAAAPRKQGRLASLDILRGLTVMLMIFVNNGAGDDIFPMLGHAQWNGMTLADMVFPFFLFIMGVASFLSLKKYGFRWSVPLVRKIVKRTVLLFAIGLAINWLSMASKGRPFDWEHLRILGVMQRIALCYGLTAFLALGCASAARACGNRRMLTGGLAAVAAFFLVLHGYMLLAHGGFDYDAATNCLARIDQAVLGPTHLYQKSPVDPEGLFSTLAATCNTLIGFIIAALAFGRKHDDAARHAQRTFADSGGLLLVAAALVCGFISLNKRVWSPSYALMTCALAAMLQGALIALVDVYPTARKWKISKAAGRLALVFGTNPLYLYVVSDIVAIALSATGLNDAAYGLLHRLIASAPWASVAYSLLFVTAMALLGYPLWKRRIFIKL